MPDECAIDGGAGRTVEDPIGVELASCIVLGMKAGVHEGGGTNHNIFRQYGIERPHPVRRGPISVRAKARDLSECMYARIRTARADDGHRGLADLVDGPFDGLLDGGVIGLALPSGIAGPIVFQD